FQNGSEITSRGVRGRDLCCACRIKFRQLSEVSFGYRKVLSRVQLFYKGFADVLDDFVALLRRHPGLRRHVFKAAGNRLEYAEGIVAVLEFLHCKGPGLWIDRLHAVGSMAGGAGQQEQFVPPVEALFIPAGDDPGVIDILGRNSHLSCAGRCVKNQARPHDCGNLESSPTTMSGKHGANKSTRSGSSQWLNR